MKARVVCFGHAVQDFVFSVEVMPETADKYRAEEFDSVGGGPAATAAVAISRLGGDAKLAARTGDDELADLMISALQDYGVDCSLVRRIEGCKSSLSAVVVDQPGERMIINYLDSRMPSNPDWLPQELPSGTRAVLVDTRWPEGALHGLKLAQSASVPGVLDGDVPMSSESELVRQASHVAFSKSGLLEFTGISDPESALQTLESLTGAWCCVTLGAEGTLSIQDGVVRHHPAFRVKVRDTLGAGDVWHGAFTLALAENKTMNEAIEFASAASALKVQKGKGRAGTPVRTETDDFINGINQEKSK